MKTTWILFPLVAMVGTAYAGQPLGATKPSSATSAVHSKSSGGSSLVGGGDNCAAPDIITGNGPFAFDTTAATTGAEGQSNTRCYIYYTSAIGQDVWFQWTANTTGWVMVNLCAGGSHDSKVAVYAGAGCPTGE